MFVLCIGLGYITLSIEELDMRDAMPLVAKGRAKLGKKRNFVFVYRFLLLSLEREVAYLLEQCGRLAKMGLERIRVKGILSKMPSSDLVENSTKEMGASTFLDRMQYFNAKEQLGIITLRDIQASDQAKDKDQRNKCGHNVRRCETERVGSRGQETRIGRLKRDGIKATKPDRIPRQGLRMLFNRGESCSTYKERGEGLHASRGRKEVALE
ncbi:hypothetical protein STAS_15593 [Striga asiatica]|uniref:Uncharacterized protein n=1 Tax=Striga asiatica TaxID=4170 RepID=A0A5A7Q1Y5_STRAF|nr:hypothetical protein STAS_15593 [Striga asiatica]